MIRLAAAAFLPLVLASVPDLHGQDLDKQAVVETSEGVFVLSFYPDKAPRHVQLFLKLAAEGAYDGTLFHRVIRWGIIQGGDPLSRDPAKRASWGTGGMNQVPQEISDLKHVRGALSTVLLPGKPDSGGSQFFICVTPQAALDGQYTVYGTVVEGIQVVDRISESPADSYGRASSPVLIRKVTLRTAQPVPPPPFSQTPVEELARYTATLDTALGSIKLAFSPDLAPNHVRNFLRLAQAGFYDGTAFHRIVPDFVVQGGLLSTRLPPLPDFRMQDLVRKLKAEFSKTHHARGILSMARYDDPDSAETSFFICLGDADSLDGQYTIFGKVEEGMDVLDKFQKIEVDGETPKQRIELKKVTITTR